MLKDSKYQFGITYIEVIIVASIIIILSAVSVPVISQIAPHYRLKGGTQELVNALRDAQNRATTTQNTNIIRLDSTNTYSLHQVVNGNDSLIYSTTLPNGVSFSQINFTDNQVGFTSSGAPNYAGTAILVNTRGETMTVEVTVSGQVKNY